MMFFDSNWIYYYLLKERNQLQCIDNQENNYIVRLNL